MSTERQPAEDLVHEARQRFTDRMTELAPLVEEATALQAAILEHADTTRSGQRSLGRRAQQTLTCVRDEPGLTATEIAQEINAPTSTLYRALNQLTQAGLVVHRWQRWYPTTLADAEGA